MSKTSYYAGNSLAKIIIYDNWKVVDIGSGGAPHPRADVLVDKYTQDDFHRSGLSVKIPSNKPFINADAECLPFKNGEFDYSICSHIAEHMPHPEKFCAEMQRISKQGYIETPSIFSEILFNEPCHLWYIRAEKNTLVFRKKKSTKRNILQHLFHAIYYLNIDRGDEWTIRFSNKYLRSVSTYLAERFLRPLWPKFKRLTYVCFEWKEQFNYKIIK